MVSPAYTQPQVFTVDNLQDVFKLVSQGFEAYQNAAAPQEQQTRASPQTSSAPTDRPAKKQKSYQPDVDIVETSSDVIVEVSLPGVQKSDINIEYDAESNRILLTGNSSLLERSGSKSIRHERPTGRFERVVGLNKQAILPDQISATHEHGILTLIIPKNVEAETKRKITIS